MPAGQRASASTIVDVDLVLSADAPTAVAAVPSLAVKRFGTPPNPDALQPGLTSGPAIGATWDPYVDHTTFFPGALVDVLGLTAMPTGADLPTPYGTLLCDISSPFRLFARPAGVPFAIPVPFDCSLIGATACAQAASTDSATVQLTNALDVTAGTF